MSDVFNFVSCHDCISDVMKQAVVTAPCRLWHLSTPGQRRHLASCQDVVHGAWKHYLAVSHMKPLLRCVATGSEQKSIAELADSWTTSPRIFLSSAVMSVFHLLSVQPRRIRPQRVVFSPNGSQPYFILHPQHYTVLLFFTRKWCFSLLPPHSQPF